MPRTVYALTLWVARDKDGDLFAYEKEPFRVEALGMWMSPKGKIYRVKNLLFDHLSWDDEPRKCRLFSTNVEQLKYPIKEVYKS